MSAAGANDGKRDAPPDAESERRMRFVFALRSRGVTDDRVLAAMEAVDRGLFVEGLFAARAYDDTPLPIACGQTISQPSIVGLMTQALEVGPRDKVLEIGTGSGYQAAVLARLARRVYTLDRHRRLVRAAAARFERLGLTNVTALTADGTRGLPEQAPFDRILVTAAAEDTPGPLLAQLRPGGIMVLPVGRSDAVQTLIRVRRGGAAEGPDADAEGGPMAGPGSGSGSGSRPGTGSRPASASASGRGMARDVEYEDLQQVRFVPLLEGLGRD